MMLDDLPSPLKSALDASVRASKGLVVAKTLGGLAALTLGATALTSCDKPEQACTSQTTLDAVSGIFLDHEQSEVSNALGPNAVSVLAQLRSGPPFKYALIAYQGQNGETHRITCSAQLQAKEPMTNVQTGAIDAGDPVSIGIVYTRQPSATGGEFIYTVNQIDRIGELILV